MPFVARCPSCNTELDVGDDVAAGQAVECPVCLTRFVPDRPPGLATDDRPARRDQEGEEDDEDDEDFDRPRRRRRRRRGRSYALDRVNGPGTGLMVIAWIGIVLGALNLVVGVWMVLMVGAAAPQPAPAPGQPPPPIIFDLIGSLAGGLWSIGVGILILYGARQMKRLEGYGWAMAAAWISVLPCFSPCCLLGLIFGIQAIQALNDAEVKAAFRGMGADEEYE